MNIFQILMDESGYQITFYPNCLHPFINCYFQNCERLESSLFVYTRLSYSNIFCQLLLSAKAMVKVCPTYDATTMTTFFS